MPSESLGIHYPRPRRTPIRLSFEDDRLLVDCRFAFDRRSLRPDPRTGRTPADLVEEGIVRAWSGSYDLGVPGLQDPVRVEVRIVRDRSRSAVPIRMRHLLLMPAHVVSPLYRRFWGIFKTGKPESLGLNWSPTQPGRVVLPVGLDPVRLGSVAAHEAGHLFGIGDAYAALYRFYDAAPGTGDFLMHSIGPVHAEEIRMMLKAHATGRMQYFPARFRLGRLFGGLRRDAAERMQDVMRRWSRLRGKRNDRPRL